MDGHHVLRRGLIMFSFVVLHLVQARDQEGFISLDCGLPANQSPYIEPSTKLNFSSDDVFIQSGKSVRVGNEGDYQYKQYNSLRYFPDGIRNCYDLNVMQGISYLIRAGFVYGNYDGRNIQPKFDIYVGPNYWTSVDTDSRMEEIVNYEIIHMARSTSLQICLVKTGKTTPYISTLELRPLSNDAYSTKSGSLQFVYRQVYKQQGLNIRYPDDVYDRQWSPLHELDTVTVVNTTRFVNSSYALRLPEVITRSANLPNEASEPLTVYCRNGNNTVVYLYFAEIQDLRGNDIREFDIVWDDSIVISAYSPKKLQIETIFIKLPQNGYIDMDLVRTRKSTLPPLINGYEVYNVMEFPYSETYAADVAALKNIQTTYGLNIISWQGDPCLPVKWKWEGVECSYTNKSTSPRIISLDLSGRGLRGIIDPVIQNLTRLQKLDLSRNSLSGEVPEFLAHMKSLSSINLSWNKLKGVIPLALLDREKNGLTLNIRRNSELCMAEKCNNNTNYVVPAVASVVTFVLVVVVLLLFFAYKKKNKSKVPRRSPITKSAILAKKRRFTYVEVEALTNNFERVIGEGGFGVVYHGCIDDTEQVAVKVLSQSSTQGYKEFKTEVELLLRVHHTNLVNLVGYCDEKDHMALVYEYAAKGDLKQHLSGGFDFNWASRLRITTETAQGLEYLHIGCKPQMIHRDVKTTNVLLNEHLQAKLADFGLSRSFPVGVESHVSTNVAGTLGYLDPEYYRTNWLSEKSDVYSLGIVLLEMITNQPVIQQTREKPHIAEWVGLMLTKGDIESIIDPKMSRDYNSNSVWKALELAMSCVSPSSAGRPNMSQVVSELKECLVYQNSKNEGRSDMDSQKSFELSTISTAEVNPNAR